MARLFSASRGSVRTAESIGPVWGELVQWRVAMMQAHNELGHWPKDIRTYAPPVAQPQLRVTSPRPYVLQADIAQHPELEVRTVTAHSNAGQSFHRKTKQR